MDEDIVQTNETTTTCPKCSVKDYEPWYYKNRGKPQVHPFKSCWDCRKKAKELRESFNGGAEGEKTFSGGFNELTALLERIANTLDEIRDKQI